MADEPQRACTPPVGETVEEIVSERIRHHGLTGRQGLARLISDRTGESFHESSLRQWGQGVMPRRDALRRFALGAAGGTCDGEPQTEMALRERMERALGLRHSSSGPAVTAAWWRLSPTARRRFNALIEVYAREARPDADAGAELELE